MMCLSPFACIQTDAPPPAIPISSLPHLTSGADMMVDHEWLPFGFQYSGTIFHVPEIGDNAYFLDHSPKWRKVKQRRRRRQIHRSRKSVPSTYVGGWTQLGLLR